MKKEDIKVETWNYKVSKRTFCFDYALYRNGIKVREGQYNSSHTRAQQTIKKYLHEGYATELVLEGGL